MINALFLLQYSFLNGLLIHQTWLSKPTDGIFSTFIISLLLSWSLNSFIIYMGITLFSMPLDKSTVLLLSALTTLVIVIATFLYERRTQKTA